MKRTNTNTFVNIVNTEIGIDALDNINNTINTISGIVDNELNHNPDLQYKVSEEVVKKFVVERQTLSYKKSKLDIDKELKQFLSHQYSQKTQAVYRDGVLSFFDYLIKNNIPYLNGTVQNVDSFMTEILLIYSPRTVRLIITSNSSFYKFLMFRYPDIFTVNIFHGRKLPRIVDTQKKDYLTSTDVTVIKNKFKELGRRDLLTMTELLTKYGFRIEYFNI